MEVTVSEGKITWQTKKPKEMGCEFMTRGGVQPPRRMGARIADLFSL